MSFSIIKTDNSYLFYVLYRGYEVGGKASNRTEALRRVFEIIRGELL